VCVQAVGVCAQGQCYEHDLCVEHALLASFTPCAYVRASLLRRIVCMCVCVGEAADCGHWRATRPLPSSSPPPPSRRVGTAFLLTLSVPHNHTRLAGSAWSRLTRVLHVPSSVSCVPTPTAATTTKTTRPSPATPTHPTPSTHLHTAKMASKFQLVQNPIKPIGCHAWNKVLHAPTHHPHVVISAVHLQPLLNIMSGALLVR
jgi:hypothetical protein